MNFFCILLSIADIAAIKPNGANTFLTNGIATSLMDLLIYLITYPKNPLIVLIFLFVLYLILYQLPNYY